MPKRKSTLNFSGVSLRGRERRDRRREREARSGRPPGWPARSAAMARRRTAAITRVKIAAIIVSRIAIQTRLPRTMSRGEIGVANMAWNVPLQVSPPMIGNVASKAAVCIAVAARRPGREEREIAARRRALVALPDWST